MPPYLISLLVFLVCYVFIATEKIDKTIIAILGATLLIGLQQISYDEALHLIDLNVVFLLIGMMLMVNILASTGLFEWIAITVARSAKGNGPLLLISMLVVTAVLSAFLDNVTTIILIAPITILIAQLLEIPAVPFLILEALFSNIGGAGTLIGDPPNIIIGSQTGLTFKDFLINLGPIALLITLTAAALVLLFLRKSFAVKPAAKQRLMLAEPAAAILDPQRLRRGLPILALTLLSFFASHALNMETGILALAGGVLMCLVCRESLHRAFEKVEWNTIFFFVGLFMLVGALEVNGLFELLGETVIRLTGGNLLITAIAILWFSGIMSAFLDNIPLVISFIPILQSILPHYAAAKGLDPQSAEAMRLIAEPLYWSLALGACLGGNGTLIGASANVVVTHIARKNRYTLSFATFSAYGFPMLLFSLILSTVYVCFRYFP